MAWAVRCRDVLSTVVFILVCQCIISTDQSAGPLRAVAPVQHGGNLLGWAVFKAPLGRPSQLAARSPRAAVCKVCCSSLGSDLGAPPSELKTTTVDWLLERTKGRSAQFDVILQTSTDRINLQAKLLDLKSKRAQVQKMRDTNSEMLREVELLRTQLGGNDDSLPAETRESLSRSEASMHEAKMAQQQLEFEEAALAAESIRLELDSERARQILKLRSLLSDSQECAEERKMEALAAPSPAKKFLGEALGLDQGKVDTLCTEVDNLCSASVELHLRPLIEALTDYASLTPKRLERMVRRWPEVLMLSSEQVKSCSRVLEEELAMSKSDASSVVEHHPWILAESAEARIRSLTELLGSHAALSAPQVGGMLVTHTGIAKLESSKVQAFLDLLTGEINLKASELGKLLLSWPRLLLLGPEEARQETVDFFLNEIRLSKTGLAKVTMSYPQLLTMSLDNSLRKTYQWLLDLEVPHTRIERVVRSHPKALGYRVEGKLDDLGDFLLDDLQLPRGKAGAVIAKFPQLLGLSVSDNLRPTVKFLVDEVGVPRDGVGKMAVAFPQLLGLSVEATLRPHVDFLRDELGVPPEKIGKMVMSFPHVLAYCVETNLRPTLEFLHSELGVPRKRLGKLVVNHPQILGYSVASKLKPTVSYLVSEVGVPPQRIPMLVERCPKLLGCSVPNNLRPTVSFFHEELRLDRQQICNIMTKYPALMGLSIDNNLRPKLAYLTDQLGIPRGELESMVGTCPQLLAYSLEKRIKPRHRLLEGRGLKLGLHSMLAPSDLTFYQRYGEGLSSMTQVVPRPSQESGKFYWHPSASLPVQPKPSPKKPRKPRTTKAAMKEQLSEEVKQLSKSAGRKGPRAAFGT
eukprot:CAMPEP_0173378688 /NCGR_PEP_ID=MMETSP1356-20130122/1812_1 /TAXON_ID=77927 ORGANISM="Hemiselmis virescens, Strain PCC157" /NCGR_SAMPLE_ID=MMETSP1356 /ASSEMBLY_ACC=CAM_ASM_000847 /LENGTH=859 /DNA_ID=CAMNT_0014331835 /DNA_START=34 /DNA_END=2613 /DNA_ORIENTATION=-